MIHTRARWFDSFVIMQFCGTGHYSSSGCNLYFFFLYRNFNAVSANALFLFDVAHHLGSSSRWTTVHRSECSEIIRWKLRPTIWELSSYCRFRHQHQYFLNLTKWACARMPHTRTCTHWTRANERANKKLAHLSFVISDNLSTASNGARWRNLFDINNRLSRLADDTRDPYWSFSRTTG